MTGRKISHRVRKVRIEDPSRVPRNGFITKKELEMLFGRSWQTLTKWVDAGVIPPPINETEDFRAIFSPCSPKVWRACEVWQAYNKMSGGAA